MKYLNTDLPLRNFRRTLKGKIYVDKSGLIEPLNELIGTEGCYVCITRPRRFGKTINANMLGAYYTKGYNSHDIFKNLQISQSNLYEEHLNQYNVMYIDFSHMPDICESYQDYIKSIRKKICNNSKVITNRLKKMPPCSGCPARNARRKIRVFHRRMKSSRLPCQSYSAAPGL